MATVVTLMFNIVNEYERRTGRKVYSTLALGGIMVPEGSGVEQCSTVPMRIHAAEIVYTPMGSVLEVSLRTKDGKSGIDHYGLLAPTAISFLQAMGYRARMGGSFATQKLVGKTIDALVLDVSPTETSAEQRFLGIMVPQRRSSSSATGGCGR